jgi:hypothetical protein
MKYKTANIPTRLRVNSSKWEALWQQALSLPKGKAVQLPLGGEHFEVVRRRITASFYHFRKSTTALKDRQISTSNDDGKHLFVWLREKGE